MQYLLIIIIGILCFIEIDKLKKQIKAQQKQIDILCKKTGNHQLATHYISDEDKELILHFKNSGKEVGPNGRKYNECNEKENGQ